MPLMCAIQCWMYGMQRWIWRQIRQKHKSKRQAINYPTSRVPFLSLTLTLHPLLKKNKKIKSTLHLKYLSSPWLLQITFRINSRHDYIGHLRACFCLSIFSYFIFHNFHAKYKILVISHLLCLALFFSHVLSPQETLFPSFLVVSFSP